MPFPPPTDTSTSGPPPPPPLTAVSKHDFSLARPSDPVSVSSAPPTSGHATPATSGAETAQVSAAPQSLGAGLEPYDIEMDSVTPSGHRRRRSSLINPANASNSRHRSPRARSQSIRSPTDADDEGKIVEESSDEDSLRPGEVLDEDELTDEDLHDDEEAGLTGKDRRRKRRKRRRNQLLDQRIAKDDISPEEKKEADRNVVRRLLINGVLIGLWYFFSLSISLVRTRHPPLDCQGNILTAASTTNGCSHPTSSTSAFLCLLPPCIFWCSSPWRR